MSDAIAPVMVDRSVVFRCDGSADIGFGHVSRCLTLADAFREAQCSRVAFVYRNLSREVCRRIESYGFTLRTISAVASLGEDSAATLRVAHELSASASSVVITDSHELPEDYYRTVNMELPVVSIDDYAGVRYASDVVINHHINAFRYTFDVAPWTELLLGPRFLPLRGEFRRARVERGQQAPTSIVVSVGGMPPAEHLIRLGAGLSLLLPSFQLEVVVAAGVGAHSSETLRSISRILPGVRFVSSPQEIAAALARAGAAVVSGGVSAYEAAAMGAPLLMVAMDRNQMDTLDEFAARNACVNLGTIETLNAADLSAAVRRVLSSASDRIELIQASSDLVDGNGSARIILKCRELADARSNLGGQDRASKSVAEEAEHGTSGD